MSEILDKIIAGDGILISVVGYIIVFFALVILAFVVSQLKTVLTIKQRKRLQEKGDTSSAEMEDISVSGEVNAAIAMAIHLHFEEIHDIENTVLTIKKVQRPYSPWSSKLYGLRQYPIKK